ncbi:MULTISPECIES: urease accessory protein UreF [Arthrobacter]|uniref:Urease accessory protein UreF n=2 Tax=Arthrobacter TaxID=1663 RepID=A0ABU9KFW2_9MICC|nr:urease accessory protein UreF [Arthrobacter sp. YJM1]MDP5225775.1 urease accessory protein UreF [Arthrobacter sp. YJM1]
MASLAALLHLVDSALPTGAFSHSFGLESFIDSGQVHDEASLAAWLRGYLDTQLTYTDAVAVRRACRLAADLSEEGSAGAVARAGLSRLDGELGALLIARQIREASRRMGRRLLEIASDSFPSAEVDAYRAAVDAEDCQGHAVLAFALAGAGQGYDEDTLVEAHLHATLTTLGYNAVRAIPLGQLAGQRVLTAVRAGLPAAVERSRTADARHFGAAAPALEIHQMRHEHQRARMFAS